VALREGETLTDSGRTIRIGLAVLVVTQLGVALWALAAPRSFYDDFPGGGSQWVSSLGPFNEHLVRDVGASFTALLVLLVLAAIFLERRLVQATLVAWLVYSVPHLAYHLTTTEAYSTGDNVASLAGLGLQVALPALLLALTLRRAAAAPDAGAPPAVAPR
jgi:hypothetical protein